MIALENLVKSFGELQVLDGISLNFEEGKTHVLLGSSGSGKSTILRLILNLTTPDSGHIRLSQELGGREKIGYVVQDGGLFPHLTAEENVALLSDLRGVPRKQVTRRTKELAELVGLAPDQIEKYPKQLSGGQKQRVSLMRALMLDPPALLLDEPLGALDPIIRSDLQEQLRTIFRELKKTVILVTHDLNEAAYLGDSIALLHKGRVAQRGNFSSLNKNPANEYVRKFLDAQRPLAST